MRYPEKPTANQMAAILHDQPFSLVSRDLTRNLSTFFRRFSHEGFAFLSKTLPRLGRAIDTALSGNVTFSLPLGFKAYRNTCLPHFLGSALRRIFDNDGHLLADACATTIQWLRTFCYYAYKIEVPFDQTQTQDFSQKFCWTDLDIGTFPVITNSTQYLRARMRALLSTINVEPGVSSDGPGVSSDCLRSEKVNSFVPPSFMRSVFSRELFHLRNEHWLYELTLTSLNGLLDTFFGYNSNLFGDFSPSKILFVPKDSRGPRTICCEDSRLMRAQKSLQTNLYRHIESSLTFGGRVNFTDQSVNQRLTLDPKNATLDLKDASDRVSLDLVKDVFPPKLLNYLLASRSPYYQLPDGSVHEMLKFAPMGSALCFPVMALIAYTSVCAAISLRDPNWDMWDQTDVYVYGDDIIVPNRYAHYAIEGLELVGLTVNTDKSFIDSRFRESCGQDTFDSHTVTPLRKKREFLPLVKAKHNGMSVFDGGAPIAHHVELMNRSRKTGFNNLANCIETQLNSFVGKIPYGTSESPYLCKEVDDEDVSRYNQAEGLEVNGKLRAYTLRDRGIRLRYRDAHSAVRSSLMKINEFEHVDINKLGARNVYLQKVSYVRWGKTYRSVKPEKPFEKVSLP